MHFFQKYLDVDIKDKIRLHSIFPEKIFEGFIICVMSKIILYYILFFYHEI